MSTRTPARNRRQIGRTTNLYKSGGERCRDGTKFSEQRALYLDTGPRAAPPPAMAGSAPADIRARTAPTADAGQRAQGGATGRAPVSATRSPQSPAGWFADPRDGLFRRNWDGAVTAPAPVDRLSVDGGGYRAKRAVDVIGATVVILLVLPVLGLLALAIRLTSRGPAVYRSVRVGRDGREFVVYKLRTMYRDADSRKDDLQGHNQAIGGVLFKIRNDPRVTPVGRILRRCSMDELPQLFNVFGGSMSLVGPRPPLPDEVRRYTPEEHRRLLVKPGLTGLWQVSGRSDLSWDESVRLDLHYVENWSLKLDLIIIARTISAVLQSRGAY